MTSVHRRCTCTPHTHTLIHTLIQTKAHFSIALALASTSRHAFGVYVGGNRSLSRNFYTTTKTNKSVDVSRRAVDEHLQALNDNFVRTPAHTNCVILHARMNRLNASILWMSQQATVLIASSNEMLVR